MHLGKFLVQSDLSKMAHCFILRIKKGEVRLRTSDTLNVELLKDTPANIIKAIIKVPNHCEPYQHNNGAPVLFSD